MGNHVSADSIFSSYLFVGLKGDMDFLQDLNLFLQKEWTTFLRSLSFPRSHFSFEIGNSNDILFGIELVSSHRDPLGQSSYRIDFIGNRRSCKFLNPESVIS